MRNIISHGPKIFHSKRSRPIAVLQITGVICKCWCPPLGNIPKTFLDEYRERRTSSSRDDLAFHIFSLLLLFLLLLWLCYFHNNTFSDCCLCFEQLRQRISSTSPIPQSLLFARYEFLLLGWRKPKCSTTCRFCMLKQPLSFVRALSSLRNVNFCKADNTVSLTNTKAG